jgi:hypothetical protein
MLKVMAGEHAARWACSPFEGDETVGLTLLASLTSQ